MSTTKVLISGARVATWRIVPPRIIRRAANKLAVPLRI